MLSTVKHPTDPSCLGDDERPYDKLKALVVDLSTSDLVKGPKFSIRDYVFFSRNKNVVNNWPFSENNMQLCLKHGVKDLLPPFQSPDLVRNQPKSAQGNVESVVVDKENRRDSVGEPSDHSNNHFELVRSNQSGCDPDLFVESTTSVNPSVSEADKEHRLTVTTTQTASKKLGVKKCRLIMKYSNIPHSSTKEATTVNAPMSSDSVAVCPVCRTFSSSSNTTLNAHIDQCLSGEYTTAKAALSDSKTNRQRRKPRKIKLMVDIYKTAPHCTLEELDRRNGSNWAASNRTFSPPEVEKKISADPDPKGLCLNAKEITNGDGSVYVDSNGRKLRILSKFSNPTNSKAVDTPQRPLKLLKGGERSMGLLAKKIKKMRNQIKKQQKCLRLDNHGKKISNGQDVEKDECMVKQHKMTETTKGWVRSEKTGVKEKINSAGDNKRHSRECMDGNLLAKHGLSSSLTNSHVKKLSDLKYPNANRAGKSGQNDKVHDESWGNPGKCHGRKRSLVLHEFSENAPSPDERPFKIRKTHARNDDNSVSNPKSSSSHHALVPKTKKFSTLSKKLSWASHAAARDSRFSPKRKFSSIEKKVFNASDEETPSHSGTDQSQDFSREVTEEDSKWGDTSSEGEEPYERNVVLKVRSSGESIISREKEAIALKSSQSTSMHSHHDPDSWNENVLMLGTSDNVEQLSEDAVGGQFTRFSSSAEAGYLGLPGRFIEEYKLPLYETEVATNLTEPAMTSSGQDIFGADLIPEAMRIENDCMMVDQIPIPGPPGSFLPSPRHMDSDDLQGHSSLTSTRVQSHDEHHDFADQSSESHASDTSTVSNSNTRRSASEKLSVVVPPSIDVDISRSTVVANVILETTSPPKTKLNNALTEMPSPNHPCRCSRKEVLLKNVGLNYQDSPLFQRRTMGETTQTRCGPNGTLDNSNSSFSLKLSVQVDDGTKPVSGIVSSESFSPSPSTPVLRLMGKNLMVMNKDESDKLFDLKHSASNPAIGQAVYTDDFHNEERRTVPRMTFQDPRFFHRAETYGAGSHHLDETLSKVVGNYVHSDTTPQANTAASHYTPQVTGFVRDGPGMLKTGPRNTSPCYETQEYVYGRPVTSLVDFSGSVQHHPNGANNELAKWNRRSLENQEYVYGRPVRSLVDSSGLVQQHPNGAKQ